MSPYKTIIRWMGRGASVGAGLAFLFWADPVFAAEPNTEGHALFQHYCAVCHGKTGEGNGVNASHLDPHPANLTSDETAALSDAEIYETIEKGGAGVDLAATMPPWGKTLSASQITSIVAYIRALQDHVPVKKGVRLSDITTDREQCSVCHADNAKRQIAPNLAHEGSKFQRDWLYQFLKDPQRIRPVGFIPLTKTKMPNFNFSDEEAHAVTDYLMTLTEDRFSKKNVAGIDLSESAVEHGKSLFSDVYGCDGCHKVSLDENGAGGIVGPNLASAASRLTPEWIYTWLQNPTAVRPDSPMPNFGLSNQDIHHLIAYIASLGTPTPKKETILRQEQVQKGKDLVEKKNCLFCHVLSTPNGSVASNKP